MKTSEDRANEWLRNYHGSIDATAVWLAYKAGFEAGCEEATRAVVEREDAPTTGAESALGGPGFMDGYHTACNQIRYAIRDLKGQR